MTVRPAWRAASVAMAALAIVMWLRPVTTPPTTAAPAGTVMARQVSLGAAHATGIRVAELVTVFAILVAAAAAYRQPRTGSRRMASVRSTILRRHAVASRGPPALAVT